MIDLATKKKIYAKALEKVLEKRAVNQEAKFICNEFLKFVCYSSETVYIWGDEDSIEEICVARIFKFFELGTELRECITSEISQRYKTGAMELKIGGFLKLDPLKWFHQRPQDLAHFCVICVISIWINPAMQNFTLLAR